MDIPIWPGSSSFAAVSSSWYDSGSGDPPTAYGFYDNDPDFKLDADRVALYCSRRLGWPILDVELQDISFYTAFEDAINKYANEIYTFRLRDSMLGIEGLPTSSNLNNAIVNSNFSNIIKISEQYGGEAGVGGNVSWYSGSITLTASVQDYDLNQWAVANNISASDLEIRRIFYEASPAVTRVYDPYAGSGIGSMNMMGNFGWGGQSPAMTFMLMPISLDLQVLQSIELNDTVRKSHFTFDLVNNLLRIFPIPESASTGLQLWFRYLKKSDRIANSVSQQSGNVTNVSNAPYDNITYSQINAVGRAWIFEYALAASKEMLGFIRGKLSVIPIPNSDVTLNQNDLLASAKDEKEKLIERLRIFLEDTSRRALLERQSQENEFVKTTLNNIPNLIYIA
jgi:hypothetical protein